MFPYIVKCKHNQCLIIDWNINDLLIISNIKKKLISTLNNILKILYRKVYKTNQNKLKQKLKKKTNKNKQPHPVFPLRHPSFFFRK